MVSDIETILDAFKGTWKPGIEEQSIRTAHTVALQGDTATASNILKFIAIPEAMKLQILGATLAKPDPIIQSGQIPSDVGGQQDTPPMTMPEPLMSSEAPLASSSNPIEVITQEEIPKPPAFGAELSVDSLSPEGNPMIADQPPIDQAFETVSVPDPVVPQSPVGSLPQNREKAFENAFNNVKQTISTSTSKPMIKDEDNIAVIKTYQEPEESTSAVKASIEEEKQKGLKLFQALDATLTKVLAKPEEHLKANAIAQFNRLSAEFPEFAHYNQTLFSSIQSKISKLQSMEAAVHLSDDGVPSSSNAEQSKPDKSAVPESGFVPLGESPVKEPFSVDTKPSVEIQPEISGGGYFAKKVAVNTEKDQHDSAPELSTITADEIKPEMDTTQELDLHTLSNGLVVKPEMTITGDSVYRVTNIVQTDEGVSIEFTDEVNYYSVSENDLNRALENPDTDPDEFFKQHKK